MFDMSGKDELIAFFGSFQVSMCMLNGELSNSKTLALLLAKVMREFKAISLLHTSAIANIFQ